MGKLVMLICCAVLTACGPQGPVGPPGPIGPPGTGLTAATNCYEIFVVDTRTFLHVRLNYNVYDFADGSTVVDCTVSDGKVEVSRFFMYGANRRSTRCVVGFDLNNWSEGSWTFNLDSPTKASVNYADLNDPYDGSHTVLDCTRL